MCAQGQVNVNIEIMECLKKNPVFKGEERSENIVDFSFVSTSVQSKAETSEQLKAPSQDALL